MPRLSSFGGSRSLAAFPLTRRERSSPFARTSGISQKRRNNVLITQDCKLAAESKMSLGTEGVAAW